MPRPKDTTPLPLLMVGENRRSVLKLTEPQLISLGTHPQVYSLLRAVDQIVREDEHAQSLLPVAEWNLTVDYFTTSASRKTALAHRRLRTNNPQRAIEITGQTLITALSLLPPEEQANYDPEVLKRGKYNLANAQTQERIASLNPVARYLRWHKSAEDRGRREASARRLAVLREDPTFNAHNMAAVTDPETRAKAEATRRAKFFDKAAEINLQTPLLNAVTRRGDRIRLRKEQELLSDLKKGIIAVLDNATEPMSSYDLSHTLLKQGVGKGLANVHVIAAVYELRQERNLSYVVSQGEIRWLGPIPTAVSILEHQTAQDGYVYPSENLPVERILEGKSTSINIPVNPKQDPNQIRLGICIYAEELDETGQRKRSTILNVYNNGAIVLTSYDGKMYTQIFKGQKNQITPEQREQAKGIIREALAQTA